MQNSLDRLFEGISISLRDSVLPALSDDFAQAQLSAAIEILGNLATRVSWREDQFEQVARIAEQTVQQVLTGHPEVESSLPTAVEGAAIDRRDSALARLSSTVRILSALPGEHEAVEACRTAASELLAVEIDLLRTGMYRP
jgi:hypothetical protein